MLNTIFAGEITVFGILLMLGVSIALGILNALLFSYKSFQTKNFKLVLALVPLISSVIIFMVNDHLGVGVAVAGAFTLVRFRSIAGNGREIVAIFASMALGLILGMGYIAVAVLVFAVIALVTLFLTAIDFGSMSSARKLRIQIPEDLDYEGVFDDIMEKYTTSRSIDTIRTVNMGTLYEITYNVCMRNINEAKSFLDEIRTRNGNLRVIISSYDDHETI